MRYAVSTIQITSDAVTGNADKATRMQNVSRETPCSFVYDGTNPGDLDLSNIASGPAIGVEEDIAVEIIEATAVNNVLKLWPWVNQVNMLLAVGVPESLTTHHLADSPHSFSTSSARNSDAIIQKNGVCGRMHDS